VLLKQWRQPQKPSLASAVRALHGQGGLLEGVTPPSYAQARRFLAKVGEVEKHRGRMGARELKNLRPFVRRDTEKLEPTDVYTADGHTFDAEVTHPVHGRPFRPEVTLVLDVATRRAVGWSASVAESSLTVLDALRHAVTTCGTPAILYVDNGSGYKNQLMTAPATGMMARLGCRMVHSLPYNSQARGIVERAHKTIFVQAAKSLSTFVGGAMDPQARKISFKRTRSDGGGLVPWDTFLATIQEAVDTYNQRFHRSLPKVTDSVMGTRRHQTPLEAWESAVSAGWSATMPVDSDDLFRPYVARLVRRGEVSLFGNVYFARELEEWHSQDVHVGYDVHNAAHVWVRDLEERLICVAKVDGNRADYFPMSFVEQARESRAEGRARRLERHLEEVREELAPARHFVSLPGANVPEHLSREVKHTHDRLRTLFTESVEPQDRTSPAVGEHRDSDDLETMTDQRALYRRWCTLESRTQAGDVLHDRDLSFWRSFRNTPEFLAERHVHEAFGLSTHSQDEERV
jgi:putative transposase